MSMSVNVIVPKLTEGGFVQFCRRQNWMEPFKQYNRLTTCIDAAASAGVLAQPEGNRYVPSNQALWFDLTTKQAGYDGDFGNLRAACNLLLHPEDRAKAEQASQISRRIGYARGVEATRLRKELEDLSSQIRASDEVVYCEGLADAIAGGLSAEIVMDGDQLVLDVEVDDSLTQEVGLGEVVLT